MVEAVCSLETLESTYKSTGRYNEKFSTPSEPQMSHQCIQTAFNIAVSLMPIASS
jgi:hypothetical protein